MSDWLKRPYEREDEDGLVYLWLKSYAHAKRNVDAGANKDGSAAERKYWREHAPIVEFLLRNAQTELLVDPERAHASSAGPAVIMAFACTTDDVVHYACVKRKYAREGFGPDMLRDLLGGRLNASCVHTHELPEMMPRFGERLGPSSGVLLPVAWTYDPWWLTRQLVGGARPE